MPTEEKLIKYDYCILFIHKVLYQKNLYSKLDPATAPLIVWLQ